MRFLLSIFLLVIIGGILTCNNKSIDQYLTKAYGSSDAFSPQEILAEVNAVRERGCTCPDKKKYKPAPPLSWNDILAIAAKAHAQDMAERNYFSHVNKEGKDFAKRISDAGYQWQYIGENIAYGHRTEKEVVKAWINSNGHCQNIMNPNFKEMGAAQAGSYWVQELGAR